MKQQRWKRVFLTVEGLLCCAAAALSGAAVIGAYREGMAKKAGDALAWVFTREGLAARLGPVLPVLALCLVLAVAGRLLGVRDESPEPPAAAVRQVQGEAPNRRIILLRYAALGAGLLLIVAGALNGGLRDVLVKAVNLCAECVGLG